MYRHHVTLFGTRLLVLLTLLAGSAAHAAALFTLKGEATDVKYEDDAEVRLSLLGFSEDEQISAMIEAWRAYRNDGDAAAFDKFLQGQPTRGYLFTKAATGYSVKYAWRNADDEGRMVLVLSPGLKTRNPYMWNTPNTGTEPFTVVELRRDGDMFIMKTGLDGEVTLNDSDQLGLRDFDGTSTFATLEDDTPYYLKQGA